MSSSSTGAYTAPRPRVLADLVPGAATRSVLREIALVLGGATLTGLSAQVAIPVPGTPVPMTLQTLAVLVVGAAYGWRRGLSSMALYAAAGIAGVPWFAEHKSGWAFASSGYVLGFVLAAALVGWLAERRLDRRPLSTAVIMTLGNVVIYACGVSVLMAALDLDLAGGWKLGVQPFLLGDAFKIVVGAGVLPLAWYLLGRRRGGSPADQL